ncbi:MAG: T9SS type A sorting domain-containing protein, partial [Candidatus Kapaibacteriota bacterium]
PSTVLNAVIQPKDGGQMTNSLGNNPSPLSNGVSEEISVPSLLIGLSPNPVSETLIAEIPFFTGIARLQILNARGEEVISGMASGGERLSFDVRSLASGVYFVRFVGEHIQTTRLITVVR